MIKKKGEGSFVFRPIFDHFQSEGWSRGQLFGQKCIYKVSLQNIQAEPLVYLKEDSGIVKKHRLKI